MECVNKYRRRRVYTSNAVNWLNMKTAEKENRIRVIRKLNNQNRATETVALFVAFGEYVTTACYETPDLENIRYNIEYILDYLQKFVSRSHEPNKFFSVILL